MVEIYEHRCRVICPCFSVYNCVFADAVCGTFRREEQQQRGKIVMEMWKCEPKKFESSFFASIRPVLSENVFCVVCRRRFCAPVLQHDIFGTFCVLCVSFGIVDTIDKM